MCLVFYWFERFLLVGFGLSRWMINITLVTIRSTMLQRIRYCYYAKIRITCTWYSLSACFLTVYVTFLIMTRCPVYRPSSSLFGLSRAPFGRRGIVTSEAQSAFN
jgi:hypothetical protein